MEARGLDTLDGAAGDDTFRFQLGGGADQFIGFVAGAATEDQIELIGFGPTFDSFAEVIAAAMQVGADTVIDFGAGDVITLENTTLAALHADDFFVRLACCRKWFSEFSQFGSTRRARAGKSHPPPAVWCASLLSKI